jgi:hypothetical protein
LSQAIVKIWRPVGEEQFLKEGDVVVASNLVPTNKRWAELGPKPWIKREGLDAQSPSRVKVLEVSKAVKSKSR